MDFCFQVLLLEHDIPHDQFSDFVLACLPSIPWIPPVQTHRKDLRSLFICSVDPPGCTDIDDALHCRQLSSDQFEVRNFSFLTNISYFLFWFFLLFLIIVC